MLDYDCAYWEVYQRDGKILLASSLYDQGIITLAKAAEEVGLSEEEFTKKAAELKEVLKNNKNLHA